MSPATRRRRINQCEYRRYHAAVEIDISVDFFVQNPSMTTLVQDASINEIDSLICGTI